MMASKAVKCDNIASLKLRALTGPGTCSYVIGWNLVSQQVKI